MSAVLLFCIILLTVPERGNEDYNDTFAVLIIYIALYGISYGPVVYSYLR